MGSKHVRVVDQFLTTISERENAAHQSMRGNLFVSDTVFRHMLNEFSKNVLTATLFEYHHDTGKYWVRSTGDTHPDTMCLIRNWETEGIRGTIRNS